MTHRISRRLTSIRQLINPVAIAAVLCSSPGSLHAADLSQRIQFWAHEAPLEIVIEQLALLSGHSPDIAGALDGKVSGTFDDSLRGLITFFSDKYELLFDIDNDTLHAISSGSKSIASVEIFSRNRTQSIQDDWQNQSLPGSRFSIEDGRVNLSGHPAFVHRITQALSGDRVRVITQPTVPKTPLGAETTAASHRLIIPKARVSRETLTSESSVTAEAQIVDEPDSELSPVATELPITSKHVEDTPVVNSAEKEKPVVAPVQLLENRPTQEKRFVQKEFSGTPATENAKPGDINWVNQIPGFSTF